MTFTPVTVVSTDPLALLSDTTLGSASATIDVQNISGQYSHLRLMLLGRGSTAATGVNPFLRFNNDSGANYDVELAVFNNADAYAGNVAQTEIRIGSIPAASAPADTFGSSVIDVPFYQSNKHKTLHYHQQLKIGAASLADIFTVVGAGIWRNTSAVNRVTFGVVTGNFDAGSRLMIYGIL